MKEQRSEPTNSEFERWNMVHLPPLSCPSLVDVQTQQTSHTSVLPQCLLRNGSNLTAAH